MTKTNDHILVVGIASSAGGLDPMITVVEKAVCHENMAFVLVPHLSRDYESALPDILRRVSKLKIKTITHNMEIEKCHLYVLPPGQYAIIKDGKLCLIRRPDKGANHSADVLFASLAKYYRKNAIGIVLSGADVEADGSEGIVEIKHHGGHTYAQEPATAEFKGMPEAAIATGMIDSVMSAEDIGNELALVSWAS